MSLHRITLQHAPSRLPVLGLDKVAKVLWLLISVVVVAVVIVSVVRRANVLHLVDTTALGAALDRAVLGDLFENGQHTLPPSLWKKETYRQPNDTVRVGRVARATGILLLAGGSHQDGLLQRAQTAGIQWPHVEDVDTLHLSENLKTLNTGGLLEVGRDGTGGSTGADEIIYGLDVCEDGTVSVEFVVIVPDREMFGTDRKDLPERF